MKKYKTILDVACGSGRLHPYLRELGYEVWGIDINDELLKLAKKRNKSFKDCYIKADMRYFDLGRKFDVALSWFTSFGYFSDEENLTVLKNLKKHIRRNDLLILDIPSEDIIRRPPRMFAYEYEDFIHAESTYFEGKYIVWIDEI